MPSCAECGYEYESLDRLQIGHDIGSLAAEHRLVLTSVPARRLRGHPRPDSWSALEYGCHVRDVLRFQRDRVILAQTAQTPRFSSMRRDERAVEERYNEQDPARVAGELATAAGRFTATLAALDDAGWLRAGLYPWPTPQVRTVEWIGRRTAHELAHHLFDERRLLNSA
ncbi:MAG TPA: DinB family protein [Streptosporangiaceae bacterium]|nr:DinB family protein [Streptosporangiaceae bacterium]